MNSIIWRYRQFI